MEFDPAEQQYALEQALSELAEAEQQVVRRQADIEARDGAGPGGPAERALPRAPRRTRRQDARAAAQRQRVQEAQADARGDEAPAGADRARRGLEPDDASRRPWPSSSRRATGRGSTPTAPGRSSRASSSARRSTGSCSSGRTATRPAACSTPACRCPSTGSGDTVSSGRVDRRRVGHCRPGDHRARERAGARHAGRRAGRDGPRRRRCPGQTFAAQHHGAVGRGAPVARPAGPLRQFEVTLRLDKPDPRLRPGTTVRVADRRAGGEGRAHRAAPGGVPARAAKSVVYVRAGDRFEAARGEGDAPVGEPRRPSRACPRAPRWRW